MQKQVVQLTCVSDLSGVELKGQAAERAIGGRARIGRSRVAGDDWSSLFSGIVVAETGPVYAIDSMAGQVKIFQPAAGR